MKKLTCSIAAGCLAATLSGAAGPCGAPPRITTHVTVTAQTNVVGRLDDLSGLTGGIDISQVMESALAQVNAQSQQLDDTQKAMLQGLLGGLAGAQPATGATETKAAGPQTWLGVATEEISDDLRSQLPEEVVGGLIVRHVDADSPAAKAGLQVNDLVLKLADQMLVTPDQLRRLVQLRKAGEVIDLTVLRKGKEAKLQATLVTQEAQVESEPAQVIVLGQPLGDLKINLPPEVQKMLQGAGSPGATVFSTSIVIRSSSGGFSSSGGSHLSPGGSGAKSGSSQGASSSGGLSARTVNGQTTITHNGKEVFSGPTTGMVSTRSMNNNGTELAAAFDGDKVLWENTSGAAEHLRK